MHYISTYFIKYIVFYEFAVIASKHIGWNNMKSTLLSVALSMFVTCCQGHPFHVNMLVTRLRKEKICWVCWTWTLLLMTLIILPQHQSFNTDTPRVIFAVFMLRISITLMKTFLKLHYFFREKIYYCKCYHHW